MNYKISDVTKALKKVGIIEISADEALSAAQPANTYFKYKGALYINFGRFGFGIESARDAKIFRKYHTTATDEHGSGYEVATDWPGEVSEDQIINEICA